MAKDPSRLAGVDAREYAYDAGAPESTGSQSGVEGFDPKAGGHAMADRNDTTSFDVQPALQKKVDLSRAVEAGQEEAGHMRYSTSGIVGRVGGRFTQSEPPPGRLDLQTPLKKHNP